MISTVDPSKIAVRDEIIDAYETPAKTKKPRLTEKRLQALLAEERQPGYNQGYNEGFDFGCLTAQTRDARSVKEALLEFMAGAVVGTLVAASAIHFHWFGL